MRMMFGAAFAASAPVARSMAVRETQVIGVGTAGSALVTLAFRERKLLAAGGVCIADRDHEDDRYLVWNVMRERSPDGSDPLVVAALGGRDGGRLAAILGKRWATDASSAVGTAIFVMPFAFEEARMHRAQSQLAEYSRPFHKTIVLHNENAVLDPTESWIAVHDRSNAKVLAAISAQAKRRPFRAFA